MPKANQLENVEVLLEGLDEKSITSILTKWKEISDVRKQLDILEDMLKTKIKTFLKERSWEKYNDSATDISVTLSTQKRQTIDKTQLKMILTEGQLAQIMRTTSFQKLNIVTPETRERLKKFVRPQLKKK